MPQRFLFYNNDIRLSFSAMRGAATLKFSVRSRFFAEFRRIVPAHPCSRSASPTWLATPNIDGSKFKAVNNRDKNFTRGNVERRRTQFEEVLRAISLSSTADRQERRVRWKK
ncbi:hypothetical protein IVB14_19045 [Bradyrhizobium sp. 180]|uniref:hypothetical protein n=1 Tax=Bradyrhizobium sp. 180 TaxID=2782650 RepID=UPI001FF7A8C2|nr:hypothetical protein [Bradyrhizobium sp. 180]MCK1492461.1 hypothetical protein [Bradyrhizobium sp. 180]